MTQRVRVRVTQRVRVRAIVSLCRHGFFTSAAHSNNGVSTNLYCKKIFTCLYTNFESLSPMQYKINLISVLIYRAFQICSSYIAFHDQVCKTTAH